MTFQGRHADELAALLAVASEGSLVAAARLLSKDPTVISRRLTAMEKRLGVRLLVRSTRQVQLTDAGNRLVEQLQHAEALIAEAQQEAAAQAAELRGKLKVAFPAAMGRMWLAPLLARFMRAYPALEVEVRFDDRYVDLIADRFDIAIRVGVLSDSRLVAKKLGHHARVLGASADYLREHGSPSAPEDLPRHNCLELMTLNSYPQWKLQRGDLQAHVRVQGTLRSEDSIALLEAARAGVGIIGAGEWLMAQDFAAGHLVRVLPDWSFDSDGGIFLVRPSSTLAPARTRAFMDFMCQQFAAGMPWPSAAA